MTLHKNIADAVGANVSQLMLRTEFESAANDILALLGPHAELAWAIHAVEQTLPGWGWLTRADAEQGYFANIMTPDFAGGVALVDGFVLDFSVGERFMAYAKTPGEALLNSLGQVTARLKKTADA
ncbi:hypothetical protein HOU02_gp395 [Caulobacter phage CcrBL9]|uniref:Uncharacterized protein n=1 Tax=Caulobacter phage CcrBL9 TaxID=2283270 RepID=A0A385ECE8_9CAUD|nr:hypothetical protein HOU02_gp395 [Caulobacter phage CcrBL9]AXQ69330.1 hypothetical protein CcrBL9_gp306 [Caulobacter phage CcrBL9]